MHLLRHVVLLSGLVLQSDPPQSAQGADTPEAAIDGLQKALRKKDWDALYDLLAPSERQRMERDLKERKLPDATGAAKLLGLSEKDLVKLSAKEFYVALTKKMDQEDPGTFEAVSKAGLKKKEREGEDWLFESDEESRQGELRVTRHILIFATRENGQWYVNLNKGFERTSAEENVVANLLSLSTAEADFRAADRDGDGKMNFWVADVRGLYSTKGRNGDPIRLIEKELAAADGAPSTLSPELPELKAQPRAGYLFASVRKIQRRQEMVSLDEGSGRNLTRFAFVAYPGTYGHSSKWTFLIDDQNTIWRKDTRGRLPDFLPEDPLKNGWVLVQSAARK